MPSKYFQRGTHRAQGVEDLFAKLAPHYDRINDLQSFGLHRVWKRRLVRLAAVRATDQILDVCCGTGDIALRLAAEGSRVTGLDFSAAMLSIARQRAENLGFTAREVHFVTGDALQLPFPNASFDAVTIAYGLRNLADLERGLDEITRVLRPAGRLIILDFSKPENPVLRWLYFQYLRWVVPVFGRLFCGDADTHGYILDSLRDYPTQQGLLERLTERGFQSTRVVPLMGGTMCLHIGHRGNDVGTEETWTAPATGSTVAS